MINRAVIISINNTKSPSTGGEYVFKVIKDALMQKFVVCELSIPIMMKKWIKDDKHEFLKDSFNVWLHLYSFLRSLYEREKCETIIVTSCSPIFPVFGHVVYHQPKAGLCEPFYRPYLPLKLRVGFSLHENEKFSPLWLLAKKSYALHLSNSFFTRDLIKRLYGLDSLVLYPPVRISPFCKSDFTKSRKLSLIIVKPKAVNGIMLLPEFVKLVPKNLPILVIGDADFLGFKVMKHLKKCGWNIKYLGRVSEEAKLKLFGSASHYLHLGLNETFGMTIVEAMAKGCVPVVPKSGAIPEFVPSILFYSDIEEAAQKIKSNVGDGCNFKKEIRKIAEGFREEIFKGKFTFYLNIFERNYM